MTAETMALLLVLLAVILVGIWSMDRARNPQVGLGRPGVPTGSSSQALPAVDSESFRLASASVPTADRRGGSLAVGSIPPEQKSQLVKEWRSIQLSFVEDPGLAVRSARRLAHEVVAACGVPPAELERRADEIGLRYPALVRHYLAAEVTARANEVGESSVEDLREAMVQYKGVFHELLEAPGQSMESTQVRAV